MQGPLASLKNYHVWDQNWGDRSTHYIIIVQSRGWLLSYSYREWTIKWHMLSLCPSFHIIQFWFHVISIVSGRAGYTFEPWAFHKTYDDTYVGASRLSPRSREWFACKWHMAYWRRYNKYDTIWYFFSQVPPTYAGASCSRRAWFMYKMTHTKVQKNGKHVTSNDYHKMWLTESLVNRALKINGHACGSGEIEL